VESHQEKPSESRIMLIVDEALIKAAVLDYIMGKMSVQFDTVAIYIDHDAGTVEASLTKVV